MSEFSSQTPTELLFRGYEIVVPSAHPIIVWNTPGRPGEQPYRESGLIHISRALKTADKTGVVIDIGANVGDSMVIIASNSELPVHCVEASDFFFGYLKNNIARHFASQATPEQCFVTGREGDTPMGLMHWGGTAKPISAPFSEQCGAVSIRELLARFEEVALLKVDTDGYDMGIILGAFEAGQGGSHEKRRFPIYFEFEITLHEDDAVRRMAQDSQAFFHRMVDLGYDTGFFWDDLGRFLGDFDLVSGSNIRNIINYMTHIRQRPVWGFDICLMHREDIELAKHLRSAISDGTMIPLR